MKIGHTVEQAATILLSDASLSFGVSWYGEYGARTFFEQRTSQSSHTAATAIDQ